MCLTIIRNVCRANSTSINNMSAAMLFLRTLLAATTNCTNDGEESPDNSFDDEMIANKSFINDIWVIKNADEIIIKTFAFLPVISWGILGNLVLIFVIIRNKHLRSPSNLLIGNMAFADLLSLLINPWMFLYYHFYQNYQMGEFGCKVESAVECTFFLTSVMTLSAISYDRLTAIVIPQETRFTVSRTKFVMFVIWISSALLAAPLYFYRTYKERQWLDFLEKYCTEDIVITNIYWHVIITMFVWFPLIVMSVCYISILVKLEKYEKKIKGSIKPIIRVRYKAKVAKTMFIVVITFIICHIPYTALIFYRSQLLKRRKIFSMNSVQNQVNGTYQVLWFTSKYLIYLNAGLNPIIYGLTNEKFRKVFKILPIVQLIFGPQNQEPFKKIEFKEKKKTTETTMGDSNIYNKIFTIFKARSPFINNIKITK